jgi:signal transduction histidine kinase
MSPFNIGDAVQEVVAQFEPVLAEKARVFEVFVADDDIEIRADRSRIIQVVSNLVENSSKYSPPETVITVDVHRRGAEIVITVTD